MKKIILALLLLFTSCGFEPIYLNKDVTNLEFKKITIEGEDFINKKINSSGPKQVICRIDLKNA